MAENRSSGMIGWLTHSANIATTNMMTNVVRLVAVSHWAVATKSAGAGCTVETDVATSSIGSLDPNMGLIPLDISGTIVVITNSITPALGRGRAHRKQDSKSVVQSDNSYVLSHDSLSHCPLLFTACPVYSMPCAPGLSGALYLLPSVGIAHKNAGDLLG